MASMEPLSTLAEVSVAFIGFTGVVVVLGSRSSKPWSVPEQNMIETLLSTSVGSAVFALFPLVLGGFSVSPTALWRSSAALFTAYHVVSIIRSLRRGQRGLLLPAWAVVIAAPTGFASILATLAVSLGFFAGHAASIYTAAVFHLLLMAAIAFSALLLGGNRERSVAPS